MQAKKRFARLVAIIAIIIAAFIVFSLCTYSVNVNEGAIILRFGKIHHIEDNTGLHIKAPFIDSVTSVYTGDILYDISSSDVITSDKKSMIADDYVVWSVKDLTKFYQTLGARRERAVERIDAAVYNATKNTISSMKQEEIIAARGRTLTDLITKASNKEIGQYGITIEITEIKALDLPYDNKESVYERMISERENIAASFRAKGEAEAKKIMNDTDRQVAIINANAKAEAAKIEAEGEAEYMKTLSDAYNAPEKAEFYNYLRSLDALNAMVGENKTIILDKNSEFARILYGE